MLPTDSALNQEEKIQSEGHSPTANATSLMTHPTTTLTAQDRLEKLGVDLSKYQFIDQRENFKPIISRKWRELSAAVLQAIVQKTAGFAPDPWMLTHIVTTRCNYSCGFCSFADTLNAKHNELTLEEIEQVYATIGRNLNVIVYSGGETTLNRNLAPIIEAAYRLTPVKSVYIISNAWKPDLLFQITHRVMQRCPNLHLTWSLSIEGPKEHNNSIRHTHAESWDAWQNTIDTMEGLKRLREKYGYDQLDVQLCTVCTPDNIHVMDDWYAMIAKELQPDKWNLNLMRRSVQMSNSDLATFEDRRKQQALEPFEQKYVEITEALREDVINGKIKFNYHTATALEGKVKAALDLISQEENRRMVQQQPPTFGCKAGTHGAFIGSEGELGGCEEFVMNPSDTKSFGNLRDVGYDFQKLWHSGTAQKYRELAGKSDECVGCTLESQRNYPSVLASPKNMGRAVKIAMKMDQQ